MSTTVSPPPPAQPLTFLFQGDSITDAFRKPEEINPGYQLGCGYVQLVGSKLAELYPGRVHLLNRGRSGHTVRNLLDRWQADTVAHHPDVVSILVGVNSTIRHFLGEESESEEAFRQCYAGLLDQAHDPQPRWILVEPFLLPVGVVSTEWQEHLAIRQRIVREISLEHSAIWVPLQDAFDAACHRAHAAWWTYDGIHPTHAGAALIAHAWWEAMSPHLDHIFDASGENTGKVNRAGGLLTTH